MFKFFVAFVLLWLFIRDAYPKVDSLLINRLDSLIHKAEAYNQNMPDSALPLFQHAVALLESALENEDDSANRSFYWEKLAYAVTRKGVELYNTGDYASSLSCFLSALSVYEKLDQPDRIGYLQISLGRTYRNYGPENFPKSINAFCMADSLFSISGNIKGKAAAARELGWLFTDNININTYNPDTALYFFYKSSQLLKNTNFEHEMAKTNTGISWVLGVLGRYDEALRTAKMVLAFYEKNEMPGGMGDILYTIGELYAKKEKYQLSLIYLGRALKYANQGGNTDMENNILEVMSTTCYKMGDFKNAYDYFRLSVEKKFQMLDHEKINTIEELKTKYETEKKESEIFNLNQQKKLQLAVIYILGAGFLIIAILFITALRLYRGKKVANLLLSQQNAEIIQQKEEITTQRDEIEAQRDLVMKQKQQIETIHQALTSNIEYARQIQNTLLPDSSLLNQYFKEHFILFKPRDGVSGDFYWAARLSEETIAFCVADCTGHGVTGALMSMLGISFLNDMITNKEACNPASFLATLRDKIIQALQQKGIRGEHKDGLDIALCMLNTRTLQLQFSGAMNPCWIFSQLNGTAFIELKPNLMPVAIHHHMQPFKMQEIQLQPGDKVYLFTDGYTDQPGGEWNKKIQMKHFRELLIASIHLTMGEQKQQLENYFENWKGTNPQIDDVTILGIKI